MKYKFTKESLHKSSKKSECIHEGFCKGIPRRFFEGRRFGTILRGVSEDILNLSCKFATTRIRSALIRLTNDANAQGGLKGYLKKKPWKTF